MNDKINFQSNLNDLIIIGKFKNKVIYYDEKNNKLFYSWQEDTSFSSNYLSFIIFYHFLVFFNDNVIVENIFRKIGLFIASTIAGLIFFYDKVKKRARQCRVKAFLY